MVVGGGGPSYAQNGDNEWARNVKVTDIPASATWKSWRQNQEDPHQSTPLNGRVTAVPSTPPLVGVDADIATIEGALTLWAAEAEEGEDRREAQRKLMKFLRRSISQDLQWEFYHLKALPDIWEAKLIATKLQILNLRGNSLESLPRSFCELTSLQSLSLADNKLRSLPSGMSNFTALKWLNVSYNPSLESIHTLNADCQIVLFKTDLSKAEIARLEKIHKIHYPL